MLAVLVTAFLLTSSYGNAQNVRIGCFSSLDCRGIVNGELSASQSECCVSGGGLSFQTSKTQPCLNCFTKESFKSEGNSFYVGFFGNVDPKSSSQINKVRFSIDPVSGRSSTIFVKALGVTNAMSAPEEVTRDARRLNLKSPSERSKGVLISSKDGDPLSVIAYAEELQSSDAFKVLPCIKMPTHYYEYYAVSVPISQIPVQLDYDYGDDMRFEGIEGNSAIVIVTTEDDTTLQITLTQSIRKVDLGDDIKKQIPKGEIEAGETVTISLSKRMQTLYLPSENDLSGSHVVSDKPIMFTSGHECGTVPSNISFCDQMVEQIPPTSTWGRRFITAPFAQRQSGDIFKMVASKDNTVVRISCTNDHVNPVLLDSGEIGEVLISSNSSCYFQSNRPILLVQFSMSSNVDRVFAGDPFMVIVPPVEQYRSMYKLHSFRSSVSKENEFIGSYFMNILVPVKTDLSGIRLNDRPVTNKAVEITCPDREEICAYSILVSDVTDSPVLSHNSSMSINAIVYWFAFRVGYGYFAGMTQIPIALPAISLSASEYSEFENTSSVTVTVVREGDLNSTASVRLQTLQLATEKPALAGRDYLTVNMTVEFAPGATEVPVSIPLVNDVIPEDPESFEVFLSASPGVYIQSPAAATILINDRDPHLPVVNVSFVEASVTVGEGVCAVIVTLEKTGSAVGPVSVRLYTINDTAKADSDFVPIDEVVTFEIEDLRYERTLFITDDNTFENKEQMILKIDPLSSPFPLQVVDDTAVVTITDNDVVEVSFEKGMYSISETDGNLLLQVSVQHGSLSRTVTLLLSTHNGSATEGADYAPVSQTLVFSADVSTLTVSIAILPDDLVEHKEDFFLELTVISHQDTDNGNIILGKNRAQIIILDNDTATIGIMGERVTVREGASNPRFRVEVLSGRLGAVVTLIYSTYNINATEGEDYVPVTDSKLSLSSSTESVEVVLEVTDDMDYEGEPAESFGVRLSLLSGENAQRVTIQPSVVNIFIEDNEPKPVPLVGFTQPSYTTVEEAGSVILLVTSDGNNPDPVVISYDMNEENLQDGIDVRETSGSFTLLPGARLAAVIISLTQDTTPESEERFTVTLSAGEDVSLTVDSTTVTILDTDIADCGPLTAPANGAVDTSSGTTAGSVALYSCDQGLVLTGSAARVCGSDRQWTPASPTCEALRCGQLINPANGLVSVTGTSEGSVATYTCDNGFTLSGSATRTCTGDQTWRPASPYCSPIVADCGPLTAPANGAVDTSSGTTAGSVALYSCDQGLVLTGSAARVCGSDRQWTPASPTCEALRCGQLINPANGLVSVTGTSEGSVATYTCDNGFTLSGSATRTCTGDQTWRPASPYCSPTVADCGPLTAPANGAVDTSSGTTAGSVALYSCDQGLVLTGSAARVCGSDRQWTPASPTCEALRCGQLINPANGLVSVTGTSEGSVATYTCDNGFTLSGSATRTCTGDQTWRPASPYCSPTVADCGPLTAPANGAVDTSSGTTAGSVALYSCDQGWILSGLATNVCSNDRKWIPGPLTCEVVNCGDLQNPVNGSVLLSATTFGGVAMYSCESGYSLASESSTRICGSNGTWNGTAPICEVVDCGGLADPTNGRVSTSSITVGGVATYSCNQGFDLTGSSTRTCGSDGTWSGSAPTCKAIPTAPFTGCFSATGCNSVNAVTATSAGECCIDKDNGLYYSDGTNCIQCITFGWLQSSLTGAEQRYNDYVVRVGYLKGAGGSVELLTELVPNSKLSERDFAVFTAKRNRVISVRPFISTSVFITLLEDSVAQEGIETGTLRLVLAPGSSQPVGTFFKRDLAVTVQDTSSVVIEFKEAQYSRVESNLEIPVIVQKTEIRLAHPLTLRVQPMTIAEALARGLHIPLVDGVDITVNNTEERRRVPIRAQGGGMDFSTEALDITFPADEGLDGLQLQFQVVVPIVNDDINEADREFFILYLSLTDAPLSGVLLGTTVSIGGIDDDDVLQIMFELPEYTFLEPPQLQFEEEVTDVYLRKNRHTELTYRVLLQINQQKSQAVPNRDFETSISQGGSVISFSPNNERRQIFNENFILLIFNDALPEGNETLHISSHPVDNPGPAYQLPVNLSTTTIIIVDDSN